MGIGALGIGQVQRSPHKQQEAFSDIGTTSPDGHTANVPLARSERRALSRDQSRADMTGFNI